jgi:hypothetical protein
MSQAGQWKLVEQTDSARVMNPDEQRGLSVMHNQASTLLKATFKACEKEEKPRFVCLCCGERKYLRYGMHVCNDCFEELESER